MLVVDAAGELLAGDLRGQRQSLDLHFERARQGVDELQIATSRLAVGYEAGSQAMAELNGTLNGELRTEIFTEKSRCTS